MIFKKEELEKRIKDNYSIFGSSNFVDVFIFNGIPNDDDEFNVISYSVNRDRSIGEIDNFNTRRDDNKLIEEITVINRSSLKTSTININKGTKASYAYIKDTIEEEFPTYTIITEIVAKGNIDLVDNYDKVSVIITFSKIKGLINLRILDRNISPEDITSKDPFFENSNIIYNSINSSISTNTKKVEKISSHIHINQMTYDQILNQYLISAYNEDIAVDSNNDIIEYHNHDLNLNYTTKNDDNYSSKYLYYKELPIIGHQIIHHDNVTIDDNLYGYNIVMRHNDIKCPESRSSYLDNNCNMIDSMPKDIEPFIENIMNYIGDYISLADPCCNYDDTSDNDSPEDKISLYKDKTKDIYTMIIHCIDGNHIELRIINKLIGYVYISKATRSRIIIIDFDANNTLVDSESYISTNIEGVYRRTTKFDNGKMKFNLRNEFDSKGIISLFYSGIEGNIDIDYRNKTYNMFDSIIYSKEDEFMYIRNEYGVLTKIDLLPNKKV